MKYALLILTVVATGALPALADIEPNGTFLPGPGNVAFGTLGAGSTAINDWTVTPNSVDWIGSYWQAPPPGGYTVDLDGGAPGGITQTLTLAAGSYDLSFYLSGNPDGAPSTKTLDVTAGSVTPVFTYTIGSNTKTDMKYVQETVNFTTTGGPTTIAFASGDTSTPYGPVIGGVSLVQTPEAGFYSYSAAYALGLGALAFLVRRKGLSLS